MEEANVGKDEALKQARFEAVREGKEHVRMESSSAEH